MTSLSQTSKSKLARRIAVGAAATVMLIALPIRIMLLPATERATAGVNITPTRAAVLINATSGSAAVEMRAVGEQAKIVNAALPFDGSPLRAARPFDGGGTGLDQQRALLCLSQAIYYEAGFEPVEGRRAVAQVVLNRLRHPAFPKSVCGVVYQGAGTKVCQFSFVCDGALYHAPQAGAWRQAKEIAREALGGFVETAVGEATHYHADYVAPRWAPLLAKVAQIGQHIFYRWPGGWGQPAAFTGRYIGEPRDPLAMRPPPPVLDQPYLASVSTDTGSAEPVRRAADDVGGLLDTSKGWTLSIPAPDESGSATARMIAAQGSVKPAPEVAAVAGIPNASSTASR